MVKAIIFDLDNCLSAADEVGEELLAPLFAAIQEHNHGLFSQRQLEQVFADCWRHPLNYIAHNYGFPQAMKEACWQVSRQMEVRTPMRGYPDVRVLGELPVQRFLVTSGFRRLQESKIQALGIGPLFTAIHIDALDDPAERQGKLGIFQEILSTHGLGPQEVLVVGDNPDSEIEAGNRLGIATVQILRPGVLKGENATYYIAGLDELSLLLDVPFV